MIVTDLVETVAYRVHVPRWASMPTSGAGAAQHGGRANRPGVEAVYLSLELDTAVREYLQLSPLMPPGTLVSYHLTVHQVVDFRDGFQASHWDPLWEQFLEDWRQLWFNQRTEPPSWVLGDQVRSRTLRHFVPIASGCGRHQPGALSRSAAPRGPPERLRSGPAAPQKPSFVELTPPLTTLWILTRKRSRHLLKNDRLSSIHER